jgi:hypothetical protein
MFDKLTFDLHLTVHLVKSTIRPVSNMSDTDESDLHSSASLYRTNNRRKQHDSLTTQSINDTSANQDQTIQLVDKNRKSIRLLNMTRLEKGKESNGKVETMSSYCSLIISFSVQ